MRSESVYEKRSCCGTGILPVRRPPRRAMALRRRAQTTGGTPVGRMGETPMPRSHTRPESCPTSVGARAGWARGVAVAGVLAAVVMLASCTPRGVWVHPTGPLPRRFSATGQADTPEKWWTAFGDAKLNGLVDEALRDNLNLRTAWDRLDQARALAARSAAPLWPSLDGSGGASRTWQKPGGAGGTAGSGLSLGLAAGYEVDLWGRIRSTYDAAGLDVRASDHDLRAAAITLTAQVAGAWYQLIEQRGQLRLLDEQIKTNRDYLEIITLRFRRGKTSAADVLQQRQLVESTQGERVQAESAAQVLEHQLSVLRGRPPGSLSVTVPAALPGLPGLPRTGLLVAWIRRRPDVRAAELRVQAADLRVAAAVADQFPRLGLSISTDTSAEQLRNLFDNWLASLAANLVAPLFDGGLRRAEVERTRAAVSEQLNGYGQVILTALQEVEDALAQERKQAEYLASLRQQLKLSAQSTAQTRENYTKGTMDFIRYLTTLLAHQRLQRTHLQAQRALVQFRIDLYRALGGSWRMSPPPGAPKQPVMPQDRKGHDHVNG